MPTISTCENFSGQLSTASPAWPTGQSYPSQQAPSVVSCDYSGLLKKCFGTRAVYTVHAIMLLMHIWVPVGGLTKLKEK